VKTNAGQDWQALSLGDPSGDSGTSTAVTGTTLTDTGKTWTTNQWVGHIVATGTTYGIVVSNTSTALTIDRWYIASSMGGGTASTPGVGGYVITPGGAPAACMALSANTSSPVATDTTLAGEITTSGGGLVRRLAAFAHTTGSSSYTLTGTFTANGADALPVAVAKVGTFASMVSGRMAFEATIATANFAASGDVMVVTTTVSQ
jgi:hypothetical protein